MPSFLKFPLAILENRALEFMNIQNRIEWVFSPSHCTVCTVLVYYAHYDTVEDVFNEFVDDMEQEIASAVLEEPDFNTDRFFNLLNSMMYKEIEFFIYVAKEKSCSDFRSSFQKAINKILQIDFAGRTDYSPQTLFPYASQAHTWTGLQEITAAQALI